MAAITLLTQHVATMTQTPPHYFFLRGEFPSGESIQSAEAGLVAKVEDKQVVFGEAWERVMRLAFAVQGDPRAGAEDCEMIWRDPRLRPEGVVVDAAAKKFAMGVPLRQLLEDMGYSPQQQARILAERPATVEVPIWLSPRPCPTRPRPSSPRPPGSAPARSRAPARWPDGGGRGVRRRGRS